MSVEQPLRFRHQFVASSERGAPTLLLLHGTGGDENDMLPLGRHLAPGANLLSPRGRVLEGGMPRFFRRLDVGVFDVDDLVEQTRNLAEFVHGASGAYRFDPRSLVAVGFSNGANIAASLFLLYPGLLRGGVLLKPVLPFEPEILPDLSGSDVFVAAGRSDPMAPADQTTRLVNLLEEAGADVSVTWSPGGHGVTAGEVSTAQRWLQRLLSRLPDGPHEMPSS
ncbi:MAG: alpha/beta hydrolase [Actinomycetota bacterium]|nr:alpha/beta hydrolase [Actinomycetota bacterium]